MEVCRQGQWAQQGYIVQLHSQTLGTNGFFPPNNVYISILIV